jgi:hypothetical protein
LLTLVPRFADLLTVDVELVGAPDGALQSGRATIRAGHFEVAVGGVEYRRVVSGE